MKVLCLAIYVCFVAGCGSGGHSFLTVQGCLIDQRGTADFENRLRAIALDEHMSFLDDSAEVARQLKDSGYAGNERTNGTSVLQIYLRRDDGVGLTATNIGLPGFEVALGFADGSDPRQARAFANRVLENIGASWMLETVPTGMGAMPRGGCP